MGVYLADRAVRQKQELVQQMDAPIQQHAASRLLCAAPVARDALRALHTAFNVKGRPSAPLWMHSRTMQKSLSQRRFWCTVNSIPACSLDGDNIQQVPAVHHHRFFAQNVLARVHCRDGKRLVKVIRHRKDNRVDVLPR